MNLFVDTSNWNLIIILEKDGNVIDQFIKKDTKKVSDIMVDEVNNLLKNNGLTIKDVDNIYVTKGPGSYTGVRIALTFARTLKTLNPAFNIFVISSLLYQAGLKKKMSLLDARGNKSFIGLYDNGLIVVEPQLVENDDIAKFEELYPCYEIVKDYDFDYVKNYLELKDKFESVDEVESLLPTYLKDSI